MSTLENAAMPIVGPMVQGRGTVLGESEKEIVATWIFKTALVLQLTRPGLNDDHLDKLCHDLLSDQKPPKDHYIATGAFTGDQWPTYFHFQPLAFVDHSNTQILSNIDKNGYIATIAVGHFIGQVIQTPAPICIKNDLSILRVIFPYGGNFVWPPGRYLNPRMLTNASGMDLPPLSEK